MTSKSGLQSRQQRHALFAQRGQIAANARKGLRSRTAAEAAGDLLLHFDHAQIALGQIVIKIHAEVFQEEQDRLLVFTQPIQQIAGGTLFAASACARRRQRMRMQPISFMEQFQEAYLPIDDFQGVQPVLALLACLVGSLLHIQEQLLQVCGPARSLFFCQKDQLAQQMHQACGVLAVVQEVRGPAVVDRNAGELWQDADGFQGRLPSAGIHLIVGEGRRASHVHPVAFAAHIQPGFILMDDLRLCQRRFDLLLHRDQSPRAAGDQVTDGPFTHLDSQQVAHHFTRTGQGQQLLFDQVHGNCSHSGSILQGSLHSGGKGGPGDVLAVGTVFLLSPIFPHHQTRRRQIDDLATLSSTCGHRVQVVLARFAPLDVLLNHLVGGQRPRQARARVSRLPARFLLALLAQAFRCAHKAIRGRGQMAIVAILREPVLQGLQLLAQAAHLLPVVLDQGVLLRQQRLLLLDSFVSLRQLFPQHRILFSQRDQFFFDRHAHTLLGLTPFGKSPAHLGSYFEELQKMHVDFAHQHKECDDRIEVCYISLAALQTVKTGTSQVANISPGEPFHKRETSIEWLTSWYLLRETSITLFGPAPKTIIEPISKDEFIGAIRAHTKAWDEWIHDMHNHKSQAYAILTMCRALYTLKYGEQVSKKRAALWAEKEFPEWASLIENALLWREAWRDENVDHGATFPDTLRFVRIAISQCENLLR